MPQNIYNTKNDYVRQKIKNADDIKYKLQKYFYEMSDLSYENGSRKGDYQIRDDVDQITEQINKFYEYLRLFETVKQGNMHALEDILVFFQNNFINNCSITEAMSKVTASLEYQTSLDNMHNNQLDDHRLERKKNIFVSELKQEIKLFEVKFNTIIAPALKEYLNDINSLYFFFSIENSLQPAKSYSSGTKLKHSTPVESELYTFIWIYIKINTRTHTPTEITDLIASELNRMGVYNQLLSITGMTSNQLREHIKNIIIDIPNDIATNKNPLFVQYEPAKGDEEQQTHIESVVHLKSVINSLYNLNTGSPSKFLNDFSDAKDLLKAKHNQRFMFHSTSHSEITLKTICDYHSNSLMFIVSWILTESKNRNVFRTHMGPLIKIMNEIESFIALTGTALLLITEKTNVQLPVLTGDMKMYIPSALAKLITETVISNCEHLDHAFSEISVECSLKGLACDPVFKKKTDIMWESHRDTVRRIMKYLKRYL
ncbi:MAG: hypothetical protein JXK07_07590 [Spirochaetes bacterium]|nr:hypothetical protein [Spirochaetota bacterium]MBN2769717.1 hypothetical protein [Spirochaetota bacterium]